MPQAAQATVQLFREPAPQPPLTLVDAAPADERGELAVAATIVTRGFALIATILWQRFARWWTIRVVHSAVTAWSFAGVGWAMSIVLTAILCMR